MSGFEIQYLGDLSTRCIHLGNNSEIVTDAPKDNEGKGEKFSPTDLLAVSLGSCVLTILGIVARKMKVDISNVKAYVCKEMSQNSPRRIAKVSVRIICPIDPSLEVKTKLEAAAKGCPVHHSLHPDLKQEILFQWGSK